jgi:hypothetical protein
MHDLKGIVIRQLRAAEAESLARLSQVRKALSVLGEPEAEAVLKRPQCRADLLREYLLDKPAGVRVKDVPAILTAMGHTSFAAQESMNWLSPSQLPPGKNYFIRKNGILTLRPEFNHALRGDLKSPVQDDLSPANQTGNQQELQNGRRCQNDEDGAGSIHGVNECCNILAENHLDGKRC